MRTRLNSILGWTGILRAYDYDRDQAIRATNTIERNARVACAFSDDRMALVVMGGPENRYQRLVAAGRPLGPHQTDFKKTSEYISRFVLTQIRIALEPRDYLEEIVPTVAGIRAITASA